MRKIVAIIILFLWLPVGQAEAISHGLDQQEARQKKILKQKRYTLLFFKNHPHLLWGKTRVIALAHIYHSHVVIKRVSKIISEIEKRLIGDKQAWMCIHHYEGSWNDAGAPYYGGLQMDVDFMYDYGRDMIHKYGGYANLWSPRDQMIVAERARKKRGYWPWPNTAKSCHLI